MMRIPSLEPIVVSVGVVGAADLLCLLLAFLVFPFYFSSRFVPFGDRLSVDCDEVLVLQSGLPEVPLHALMSQKHGLIQMWGWTDPILPSLTGRASRSCLATEQASHLVTSNHYYIVTYEFSIIQ